jgi:hypothetical protein
MSAVPGQTTLMDASLRASASQDGVRASCANA